MAKKASTGPKASVQYVRTLAKRLERVMDRARDTRADVRDLWEMIYAILSTLDPEICDDLPTSNGLAQLSTKQLKAVLLNNQSEEE